MRFRCCIVVLVFFMLSMVMGLVSAAPAPAKVLITGIKWGRIADAVTGSVKVRLVLETSDPVTVDHFVTSKPNWRIVLTLRGVNADKLKISPPPDLNVIKGMSIIKSTKDTVHVVVDLPAELTAEQYKVFTLKADPKAKRPFRIVVDVDKSVPLTDLKFSSGLKGKLIALDPGHGGSDPGAIGRRGSNENKLNLDLSMLVKSILERAGAKVAMTRTTDVDLTPVNASDREELRARVMVGNNRQADIFVSIHHNASVNTDMCGTTTYYFHKTNLDFILAQSIHNAMLKGGGLSNQGVRTANFYVVKNALMPAALLEIGFMSNPQEEQTINDSAFQQKMAVAIVAGIDQFFAQAAKLRGGK